MKKKRFSVEQIVAVLKQAEVGVPVAELIRKVGVSEQTFYRWKKQYVGLESDQVREMKQLQDENGRLKQLVAVTSLRISEALGLKWCDIDPKAELIQVRRSWTMDREGKPKSRASRAAEPCVEMLAKHLEEWRHESPYASDNDWVFPSVRNQAKTPRSGSILVTDYLKKAAYAAGVLEKGEKEQFGMNNLPHTLATYLIAVGRDVKTVQSILRHANPMTALQLYPNGRSQDR